MNKLKKTYLSLAFCGFAAVGFSGDMYAAQSVPFSSQQSATYQLDDELLTNFLDRFLQDYGIRGVFSDRLLKQKQKLYGTQTGTPNQILSRVIRSGNLVSYVEGKTVYFYKPEELQREFVMVAPDQTRLMKKSLRRLGASTNQNQTKVDSASGIVEIRGVPRYVSQVSQLAEAINMQGTEADEMVFNYFGLNYAWASDRTFVAGKREITVSGVATVIRNVIQGNGGSGNTNDVAIPSRLSGSPYSSRSSNAAYQQMQLERRALNLTEQRGVFAQGHIASSKNAGNQATVVAHDQQNAIIVKDYPERIPLYRALIKKLDRPTQIIEIEATIIDVNTDKLSELGVDWRLATDDGDAEIMFARNGVKSNLIETIAGDNIARLSQLPGLQLGAIIGDDGQFIARLNALQENGVVDISSRPKVATLNDMEAVIESTTSLYIPVEGAYEVDLFQVLTGTLLRVTPHIIKDNSEMKIRLIIGVEDGGVTGYNKGVPITTRSAVNTQAIVNEGASLLLGGLAREERRKSTYKVPLLGDIPLLGALFRGDKVTRKKSERLFLLTPRIVLSDGSSSATRSKLREEVQGQLNDIFDTCEDCDDESGLN